MADLVLPSEAAKAQLTLPSEAAKAAAPVDDARLYSNNPDELFPLPARIGLPSDVTDAANAIEGKYQYVLDRYGDNPDTVTAAGEKRTAELADLTTKAKAAGLPFKEATSGGEVVEQNLAKEVAAAKMSPEDVQALLPGKLPGGVVPKPALVARVLSPIESGVAETAGGAANPANALYVATPEFIPGFVAQQVIQGGANVVGGAKKIISGQPGGGEQMTEGVLGMGMAAAPAMMAKVLPTRPSSAAAATEGRPVDDWLPPVPEPPKGGTPNKGGEINNEQVSTVGKQAGQAQGGDESGGAGGVYRPAEVRSEGDGAQGQGGNGQGASPSREADVSSVAPASAEASGASDGSGGSAAPAAEAPAAIPVGDGKAADAGTGAETAPEPAGGTPAPQAKTAEIPPPSGQAQPGNVAPGANTEAVSTAGGPKPVEVAQTGQGSAAAGPLTDTAALRQQGARPGVQTAAAPLANVEAPASSALGDAGAPGLIAGSAAEKWADLTIQRSRSLGVQPVSGPELFTAYAIKGGALIEKGLRDFGAWSGEMVKQFGEAVRPHLANLWSQAQAVAAGPTRQFAEQLQDAKDISDALKGAVTNTTYTRRPQEDDAAYANRIMQDVGGPDRARAVFNDPSRLPSSVRMALGMQILKAFDAAGRHADAANFFDHDFAAHTTDVAQGLSMLNAWHSMSKEGKLFWAQKKISDAARDATAPVQPDIDAAKTELQKQNAGGIERTTADPQVQGEAKNAITDAVTNSKETHAGVVMELAQPWASSPEILGMAREAVRAKADELLNRAPRPPGLTAPQHLRAILDDLAKRAADIASGHYQGAEPGVTLASKLQQRLGLSVDAAGRLAKALDKEFERQVEAAKAKLPKRVANQVARAAARRPPKGGTPNRTPDTSAKLSRSIPDREAEAAAKTLTDAATGAGTLKKQAPVLQEFYQRLTSALRGLLPDKVTDDHGQTRTNTDLQRIAEAFSNPEKFDTVWARLGTELRAKFGIEGMADVQNTLGRLTPEGLMETALDRSIRQQLSDAKVKIGQLVREHYTKADATKAELADKLAKQAGLEGAAAQKLAAAVKSRFEALTAATKRAALEQLLKPVKRLGLARPQLVDRLVQLSNIGAFDDPTFYNAIKERMNLPEWTPALKDQLNGLADKIGKIPADRLEETQRAQTEFLNAIERAKGISNLELGLAFYMQNILSGLTTHVRVAVHTSGQMAGAVTSEMARALAGGRLEDVPLIFEALARGGGRALTQMKDIFSSGTVVGSKVKKAAPLSVLEQIRFGEKGGTTFRQGAIAKLLLENRAAKVLNLWKYNARLITAQHMLYYAPAEEMKVALLAARQARTEGLTGRAAVDRARQILGYGAAAVRAAEAQAIREGLEVGSTRAKMRTAEILKASVPASARETARDYALRQTFLNDPYGFIGAVANSVANMKASDNRALATAARVIVPFTRIAANIFNEGLNYTPVGAARARFARTELLGHKFADITPEVRSDLQSELYAKSALGSMLLTGIAFKAAQGLSQPNPGFAVYGQGPNNPQDQAAWRAAGGIPFSVKIGNRYLSYANTPANVMLAALGNYLDGVRDAALYKRPGAARLAQNAPLRLAASAVGMARVVLEQPFLSALVEMFKTSSEPNPEVAGRGAAKIVARTASSFVVPNLLRQLDRFKDPTLYSQQDLGGILTSQVPFVRQTGRPMLNALGQPLKSPVFGLFTGTRTADPLVQTLVDHNAWPQLPDRNRTTVNGVPLTDDEFYAYCQARGTALATMLGKPAVTAELDRLARQRTAIQASAVTAPNPIARARLQQLAAGIQNRVMEKYEAAADKQAAAAVIRLRRY